MIAQTLALRRHALTMVAVCEVWNLLEMVVALWPVITAGSVALLASGLGSTIDLFSGLVPIRLLYNE